jgi:hypothetical protein
MSYDAFMVVMALIGALSALFFFLAILADIVWPLVESLPWRNQRRQAVYLNRAIKP